MEVAYKDENPAENEAVKELVKQINLKEAEAMDRILKRFCWLNALPVDISRVDYRIPDETNRPNYWEYYYIAKIKSSTDTHHFLMSRDLKVIYNKPTLEIVFNRSLITENEE